jgi:UDP-GlcNAc:undecaprenyl-phosphate GlcNAc-1-phosphate transferase
MIKPTLVLFLAASICFALTFLLLRFAHCLPFSKKPTADRWNRKVTPHSGGIALFISIAAVYLLLFRGRHLPVALAAAAFWILGTLDDRFGFKARFKFGAQALIISVAVLSGVALVVTPSPALNFLISWLWLMGITNAFNLIDNMDGLACGVTIIIALSRAVLLYVNGYPAEAELPLLLAGAFLGLLWFNFNPARIFMGDGGSMLAGFSLAALTIDSPVPHATSFLAGIFYPALTFAYPIFDTALVSVLRKMSGRAISIGGRDHSSHRLASLGIHERKVVFVLWVFTAVGSVTGLLAHRLPVSSAVAIALLSVFATMFAIFLATLPVSFLPYTLPADSFGGIRRWVPSLRAAVSISLDSMLAAIALVAAFALRFDLDIPPAQYRNMLISIPVIIAAQAIGSVLLRTYEWSWAFFTSQGIFALAGAAGTSALACAVLGFVLPAYPRGVVLLYVAIALGLTLIVRFSLSVFRQAFREVPAAKHRRVAIFRADFEGEALARFLLGSTVYSLRPVAFLDDRPLRRGVRIYGLPVRSIETDMQTLREELQLEAVLLPRRNEESEDHSLLGQKCQQVGLELCSLDMHLRAWDSAPAVVVARAG